MSIAPMRRHKTFLRRRPHGRSGLVPPRHHPDLRELPIEIFQRSSLGEFFQYGTHFGVPPLRIARLLPPRPCSTGMAMRPTRSISIVTTSPSLIGPTPAGVPVAITSPG